MSTLVFKVIVLVAVLSIIIYLRYKPKLQPQTVSKWELELKNAKLDKKIYNQTREEDKYALISLYCCKLNWLENYDEKAIQNFPVVLKNFYLVHTLMGEVNNGGFLQFFVNSSGFFAEETVEALDLIGANYTKLLLEQALQIIEKYTENHESLRGKINTLKMHEIFKMSDLEFNEEMEEELKKLDHKFYEDKDPLYKLNVAYFDKNQAEVWAAINKGN